MPVRNLALFTVLCAAPCLLIAAPRQPAPAGGCPVTQPNRHSAPERSEQIPTGSARFWHGNASLGTALWPEGNVLFEPGGPGAVLPDGALRMKFLWLKTPGTRLTITGHRLDDASAVLRSELSHEFDAAGFQPSYLIFATPGCWRVTATAGTGRLSFVTAVTKIGQGPVAAR